jgi:flagellar hook protein FlgE
MSFFTALTGLKGAQTEISTTSNNIANVGSNGFKKSRTDFGDIFGTTPLQTNIIGSGTQAKSIVQMHSQGNIVQSTNTLDMAISGQGFFAVESRGNPGQVVYTRNGAFNVNSDGYIVDSAGQSLLGYPVDSDGNVADKTLQGAQALQLNADFGSPKFTENVTVGVNLDSNTPVIDAGVEFDSNDPTTYSASSSVTIFDSAGNPKSATVYYIKTQDASTADQTYKYDTKVFVDGEELSPALTRATDAKGNAQFVDRFGQLTTDPADTGYILEGKGSPLYRADDLSDPIDSTPATLTGQNVASYLSDGQTIEIVTDPKLFYKTMEYQDLQNTADADLVPGTFWGKDFLLIDVDESGPVSIDIPPGTYTGQELAAVVQNAIRDAFGDDRKIQLTDDVDEKFTIDLMTDAGDGTTEGLATPLTIDLHSDSYIATEAEVKEGLVLDDFLTHAQLKINETLNARIQDDTNAYDVNTTQAGSDELNVSGRMFHKYTGTVDTTPTVVPTASDVISFNHVNPQTSVGGTTRYLAYTNTDNTPEVAVYDKLLTTSVDFSKDANGYLVVTLDGDHTDAELEVLRFQQNPDDPNLLLESFIAEVGTAEISVRSQVVGAGPTTVVTLNHIVEDDDILNVTVDGGAATESPVTILGKPSDHVEAYFEDTQGLVEGVDKVHYANRLVMREIGDSAKRVLAGNTAVAFNTFASANSVDLADYGLEANPTTIDINWFDDRDPPIKIGYDEVNQRFTFSAENSQLGNGTGVGFENFTVYAQELDLGVTNGLGMAAFGQSAEQSIKLGEQVVTESVLFDGPEVRTDNKRYGIQVEFDDVQNEFSFKSGTTGEALGADSAVGVDGIQNESTIAVGRYALTATTAVDSGDSADYAYHRIGDGTNRILGIPRDTVEGYTAATGLVSEPATVTGREALVDMSRAFTVSALGGENIVNVVVNGVSASLVIPEGNYKGATLAQELESRINAMKNPVSGESVGGVTVEYSTENNNFVFTTATTGEGSTLAIEGDIKFGFSDIPLGLGSTSQVRQPVQATDELGRPLYISPTGEITTNNQDFVDNMVQDYYPLYLDEGELTFDANGEIVSPITKIDYSGLLRPLTLDFSEMTQLDRPFEASPNRMTQDGYASGRLTNLEIDNFGNVNAGYSNGQTVKLGKIIVANFANASGLKQIGNSSFLATVASGDPELGEASSDGFGQILSGSLERSNVDITEELVNLITSQRNYQASAKAIETSSSMTQTIINIRS